MREHLGILRCPVSGGPLTLSGDTMVNEAGATFPIRDGIVSLLPTTDGFFKSAVQEFYENFGWRRDADGEFAETKAFVDLRPVARSFTQRCIKRLGRYFQAGGDYMLDAGCGPIPYDELVAYDRAFKNRVCLDLSANGLRYAKERIGDKGVYIQGDITNLPIADNSMDAVLCNHVIYQISGDDMQKRAYHELWRVLKPGGVALICYWWKDPSLPWRLQRIANILGLRGPDEDQSADAAARPELEHDPRTRQWFESQQWPFDYTYDIYRVVGNAFLRGYVPSDWRGRVFVDAIYAMQSLFPQYCGKNGTMPVIVLRKSAGAAQ